MYAQTVPDSLHLSDTGIWQAILVIIFADCKAKLFDAAFPEETVRERKWTAALERLQIRLSRWTSIDNHRLASWVTRVGQKIYRASEVSRPLFTAGEYRELMLVSDCKSPGAAWFAHI